MIPVTEVGISSSWPPACRGVSSTRKAAALERPAAVCSAKWYSPGGAFAGTRNRSSASSPRTAITSASKPGASNQTLASGSLMPAPNTVASRVSPGEKAMGETVAR